MRLGPDDPDTLQGSEVGKQGNDPDADHRLLEDKSRAQHQVALGTGEQAAPGIEALRVAAGLNV